MTVTPATRLGFETRAIHAGQEPDPTTGAVVPPISLATTFAQDAVGKHRGYEYARSGNPTRSALETCVASLEGARPRARVRERPRGRGRDPAHARPGRPRDHARPTRTAGRSASSRACTSATASTWSAVDLARPRCGRRARGTTRPGWSGSRRRPTRCSRSSTSRPSRSSHTPATRGSSSTTPSRRRTSSNRSRSAPTPSCTRSTKYLGGHSDVVGGFVAIARRRVRRRAAVPAERDGRGAVAVRLLSRAPRRARRSAIRMDRHCANARAIVADAARARRGGAVVLPGAARAPRPRRRAPADARLRRHGVVHARGRRGRRARRGRHARGCSPSRSRSARSSR